MKRITFLVCLGLLLQGCSKRDTTEQELPGQETIVGTMPQTKDSTSLLTEQESSIQLNAFTQFPADIDGCSCYFSKNLQEFKEGKYIYVNNYAALSILSIQNREVRLHAEHDKYLDASGHYKYKGGGYELEVVFEKQTKTGEEVSLVEGKLFLKNTATGDKAEYPFVGECGC